MRVVIVNTSERIGGAAIAASRLMEALKNNGVKAKMLVRDKQTDRLSVVAVRKSWLNLWKFVWERLIIWKANRFRRKGIFAVDIANTGIDITSLPEFRQADVIHLHWVNQGMLSLHTLRKILNSGKPVVWTLHDMWPFTGICHYDGTCGRYTAVCHHCPLLYGGGSHKDLSNRTFHRKQQLLAGHHIAFVACSHWLEEMAHRSPLLRGHTLTSIPNAINTNLFHPRDKQQARLRCGLPTDKRLLLFGSLRLTDERKGGRYLVEACHLLALRHPDLAETLGIVVMGRDGKQLSNLLPYPVYDLAYVEDEKKLVEVYNAIDLYVTPSLQDNLPNTIVEAMACGVPCVGFDVGGIPEMIDHLHNGYVARYRSAEDFANGIYWSLTEGDYAILSREACRKAVACYAEKEVARRYIDIYNKVMGHES